jgi:hypothetical protein
MDERIGHRPRHLIRSKLGEEFRAEAALAGLAGEVFLPVLRRIKKGPVGNSLGLRYPFFRTTLFVRLDPADCQKVVKHEIGVRGLVMNEQVPLMVPAAVIDCLRRFVAAQDQVSSIELTGVRARERSPICTCSTFFQAASRRPTTHDVSQDHRAVEGHYLILTSND